ncbi:DUF3426 domain-containing protein [Stenotrophomonas sp. CFBP 13725]|uniref:DUF3426 domain-containing protein n=1 Tax=Stenotrophomonas sp. CFBP 13725 TaxID=2775297 RepID=UPI00177B8409|nr:DUF3426 domain-containing protein [Stenotrophomonas sp. CFBP 13725]MBD8637115.1 DUF3426 domain-containing protein [Stenotrophomonas sp. CFBP 13725]
MPEPPLPRRPLATFLRPAAEPQQEGPPVTDADPAARHATDESADSVPVTDASVEAVEAVVATSADDAGDSIAMHADATDTVAAAASPVEPVFLRRTSPLHTPRWQWLIVAALTVVLLLQVAVADRGRLASDASTRPMISLVCSVLRCSLPTWREPTAFTMLSRDVRPVPGQAGALQVQASVRNDARWAQDWPSLRLSLSDADGRVIGTGVFTPADYLAADGAAAPPLEPGQSTQISFRVREPAASTVAFNFDFL